MAVMVPPLKYTICTSRPFLRNIPASLAIQAGRPLPLSVLLPMVSLMSWAEATEQKENCMNRLSAKITAFIGTSFSDVGVPPTPMQNSKSEYRNQKPQPKIGISRAKAQRPQRKKYFPNLAFLASWRENNPKRLLLNGKNRR